SPAVRGSAPPRGRPPSPARRVILRWRPAPPRPSLAASPPGPLERARPRPWAGRHRADRPRAHEPGRPGCGCGAAERRLDQHFPPAADAERRPGQTWVLLSRYLGPRADARRYREQARLVPSGWMLASAPSTVPPGDAAGLGDWRSGAYVPGRRGDRPRRKRLRARQVIGPVAVQRLAPTPPPLRRRPPPGRPAAAPAAPAC